MLLRKEDRGAMIVKAGTRKGLLGHVKAIRRDLEAESRIYLVRDIRARRQRQHRVDLVEVYGGHANITARAVQQGLRTLQPVDKVYGMRLDNKKDFARLRDKLLFWKPFLTAWEIACTAWSPLQRLNYDEQQRLQLQAQQDLAIKEMTNIIWEMLECNCHFVIENPAYTAFWQHPSILKLRNHPEVTFVIGHMCAFNLRDPSGYLLKKPTGWLTSCKEVAQALSPTWRSKLLRRLLLGCQPPHGCVAPAPQGG